MKVDMIQHFTKIVDQKFVAVEKDIEDITKRVDAVEVTLEKVQMVKEFDPDNTLVVYRLMKNGDDMKGAKELISYLVPDESVNIVCVKRMPNHDDRKVPLLKMVGAK